MHRLPMYIQILSFSFENDCTLEIIHEDLEAFLEIWHTVTSETHFYTHVNAKVIHITSPRNS